MIEMMRAERGDKATLHIIDRGHDLASRFVVCWNFDGKTWDWGNYFAQDNYARALEIFEDKRLLNEFGHSQKLHEPETAENDSKALMRKDSGLER